MMRRLAHVTAVGSFALLAITASSAAPARASVAGTAGVTGGPAAFSLQLPSHAACSGDSANDDFRVQSYMVPAAIDPATLQFGSAGPLPRGVGDSFRQPLYSTTSSAYVNAQTANADEKGDSGTIVNVPSFSLEVFAPGDIPVGSYNVGIACTKGPPSPTQVEKFWNAVMSIDAALTVIPAGVSSSSGPGESAAVASSAVQTPSSDSTSSAAVADAPAMEPTGGPPSVSAPVLSLPSTIRLTAKTWIALGLLLASICARISILLSRYQPRRTNAF